MTTSSVAFNNRQKVIHLSSLTQRIFQKFKLHQHRDDSVNIFVCEVKGPRKTHRVKGYLLKYI
ncbi:TPA: DNA-binding domain-containing protein [Salmonella enterica]|nr:DNA-binding domain-containing protein [Salmonella enterica]